jgi:hypothetical protein
MSIRIRSYLMEIESSLAIALATNHPTAQDQVIELLEKFCNRADRLVYTLRKTSPENGSTEI